MHLLFDIGGSHMRVGVSNDRQTIMQSKIVSTPADFQQGIQTLKKLTDELSSGGIERVSGGIAGSLNRDKTRLLKSPNLVEWIEKPLKENLEETFQCPVNLDNDAVLAGLAEVKRGAGIGKNIVAFITIGTGVGGARIVDGSIDKNTLGFEPGHQVIVAGGNLCNCGGKGHLEAYIGGAYLEKIYQQKSEEIKDEDIWEEVAKYLSIGLNNIIVHWSPEIVILGGSVMKSLPLDKVIKHLNEELKIFPQAPQIVKASLGDEAGLYGALEMLKW